VSDPDPTGASSPADRSSSGPAGAGAPRHPDTVVVGDLQVTIVPTAAHATVRLAGELDLTNADEVWAVLERVLADRPGDLTLDLARLAFVDSRGLSVLMRAAQRLQPAATVTLADVPSRVAETIRIAGVGELFSFE
jgi:anti-anti-sigma factor